MKHYPLTTPQKNIWNLQKYYADTSIANLCGAIFYQEKRDSALLQQAIWQFVRNQSGLRLRFCEDNEPRQYIMEEIDIDIPVVSFDTEKDFDDYVEKFAKEPIRLIDCPMYFFEVFQMDNKSGILVKLSHLISDAWTMGLLVNQFDKAYSKLLSNTNDELVEGNYIDFIRSEEEYMHSMRYGKDKAYWEEKYTVRPEESIIKLCPVPSKSIDAKRITRKISLPLEQKIARYCNTYSVTQAVLFEMAIVIYLSKINSENRKVTIGIPTLNRSNIREKNIAGMFVSTMPLTVEISETMTVSDLAKQIAKEHMDIFRHQKYPYADILKYLREKQNFSGNLYDVMVSYQNAKTDTQANTRWYSNGASEVPFAMHIDNRDGGDSHTINVDYQTAVFEDAEEIDYVIDRLEYIIEQIVEDHAKPIREISIVPEQEWKKLVYEFNDTAADYPKDKCIHELFTEQAQKTPDKTALIFEDKQFTYRQLDEMSNSLAHILREKGVKRNEVIPIIAKRSWHVIVAMLGVLKAGAAYMPVDSSYPEDRIGYMLEIAKSKIALLYGYKKTLAIERIDLESLDYSDHIESLENQNQAEDFCYVLYTSGTTGTPKGIEISHRNLVNFMNNNPKNMYQSYAIKNGHTMLALTTFTFDISIFEIYLSLLNGLKIVMASDNEINSQHSIANLAKKYSVDILQSTPTKLAMLFNYDEFKEAAKEINVIMAGAEEFTPELYHKILNCTNAAIFNGYGPTEITIGASFKKIEDENDITIGTPIANTQIYILDSNQKLLPTGVTGELCISGEGVGKGYLNQPELTAERFLSNPFATAENGHGKVMYRTGDLARFRADGEIEYLGRIDTQVKIRGLRIELGEIESVMSSFPGILLNAVTDKRDENNRQYLVGYYTAEQSIDESELRKHLATKLPKYMVPNYFVHLDSMPMTSSGKIDRKNLPLPDFTMQTAEYIAPETEIEKKLALIWQELLQAERIEKTDDFFECGGDSLLAITMLNRIEEEFQVTVSIKDIMEYSVLEQLAQVIGQTKYTNNKLLPRYGEKYALLPQQKAIYAACSKSPELLTYNMPAKIMLPDSIDKERLKACIGDGVNHHQALKTYISVEGDDIYGVYDSTAEIDFEEYTKDTLSNFLRPFDLGKAPLLRIGFTEDVLLFDMHHIIADGESLNIILRDIFRAYSGESLSDSEIQYSDYAAYYTEVDFATHKAFFKDMLKCEFEPLILPEKKASIETGGRSKVFFLPETVVNVAKSFAKENGLTDTMVYFGAFGILLSKYTAKDDILTNVILSNRLHKELQNVVGMFVNTLPTYFSVKGNLKEYYKRIKERILNLFQYQELPFFEIAKDIGIQDKNSINTSFVFQADGEKSLVLDNQRLLPEFMDTYTAKFDLSMEVMPLQEGCRVRLEYNRAKYEEKLIDDLFAAYERILIQLNTPDIENLADISVLSDEEKNKILYEFNDTAVDYPKNKCVHELFMEQAQKTPDKTALIFEDKQFTYRQLDEMSNSLAHLLRKKGVKRNDVIPIIAKRSWHVIVAMLGVLKASGAYMPVDPSYPGDRIEYMIDISKSKIALLYGYKKTLAIEQIDLDSLDYSDHVGSLENQNYSEDSCYVLFTSGTTGTPKGIEISHRNLVNFVSNNPKNMYQNYAIENGHAMLASTTFTFDISVFEIYLSLLNGLNIVMANDDEINSQQSIAKLIKRYAVDILQCTPTKLAMLLNHDEFKEAAKEINVIMAGAEEFTPELYHKILDCTNAAIFNGYGPTEITIGASFKKIEDENDITIGKPIANTQIYILANNQKLLPIGVTGELCIAGEGVGKGYLNRPELTAERFLPNPFATAENGYGKVMYRTGDLARFRADGEIEYLGRIDTQVKIRGLRIELGEIESVMSRFPGILLSVAADKRDGNNRQYLVGYYTAEQVIDESELRQHLATKLPKYMVPNYFVHLNNIPMTSSGKIDRKNLPLPDFTMQTVEYIPPETETEKRLALIWQELLQVERIGKTDDFFEYGGDSLLAITMLNRIEEEFQVTVSIKDIMEHSVLEQLADVISQMECRESGIMPQHRNKYKILPQQKAIYAACSKAPDELLYNILTYIPLPRTVDRERLKFSIKNTVDKQEALKTYFSVEGDEVYGIYDASAELVFEEYTNQTFSDFFRPFDLGKAPLIRAGFTEDKLLLDIHHIVADGESMNIMVKDIASAYSGGELPNSEIRYSDYSAYFAEADFIAHKVFFKEILKCEFEPVMLPEKRTSADTGGCSKVFLLPETVIKGVKDFAKENELTDTMVHFGAFCILLSKYTAKDDILTSVILSNRLHKELKDVVGMFVNTLPAYLSAKGNLKEYFKRTKELILNLFEYQELPFLEIEKAVEMQGKMNINTSFVYQAGEKTLTLGQQKLLPEFVDTGTAKFDFSMEVTPLQEGYRVRLEYNRAKYDEKLIDNLFAAYERILIQLNTPDIENLANISVLSDEEKNKILYEFNDTAVDYPKDKCVHELFTEQAKKTQDKTALIFEDKWFAYRQLDKMSNSLAHFLREKGVKRNDVIPIIAKRSWHVIVAMLGVLKAGGAYMLIDSQYPDERISYMVHECKADTVLTYDCTYSDKKSIDLASIDYKKKVELLDMVNEPDDILCVIHTSGSSGIPKVSALTHRNIMHYISYAAEFFDRINQAIAATIITFDAFVQETIVALCRQIPVVLLSDSQITNQVEFESVISKYEDSFLFQTPTKLSAYIRNSKSGEFIKNVKKFVIGGEVFPQELYDRIKSHNPDCDVYNIYGPTETTVCVTVKRIEDGLDIPIGKPIANTQIYILDNNQKLLPIGVTGELYIAGDGVGKGYLNRPELTAERFLPNPFATAENGHGKVMYRTGDLARFREDGEIEYLGRIDTQVKIRGLRIELGEIESVMSSFSGILLNAVTDKCDENNRQYLVGYYTAEQPIDESELRQHLSAKLPKYMVPNYFVYLDSMPMTSSGKIDRKNLPLPDFNIRPSAYVPPETEQEKICCHVLEELLSYDQIGVADDFFEIGGDSLRAIEYLAKLHDNGLRPDLQNIFDYPTVRKLCDFLEKGVEERIEYQASDFDKYHDLLINNVIDDIDSVISLNKKPLGNIFLTGMTGFLGAHILDSFMKEEKGKAYCLVRSNSQKDGEERIRSILQYYFGNIYDPEIGKRIIPVFGDIERDDIAEEMPTDIQTVVHTAASVKHYGSYSYFERVNVEGTRHIISYAGKIGAKLIHVSTISVSGNSMADDFSVYRSPEVKFFAENTFYIGQPLDNVYVRSKFEAEKAVFDAMLEGLDAKIIRIGNLTNRATDYRFQPNYRQNAFLTRVKAALEFGLFPDYLMKLYSEFSPVDLTAEGVVKIAQYAEKQCVFHLNSNRPIYHDRLLEVLEQLNICLNVVNKDTFNTALRNTMKSSNTEYIYEAFQNDMDEDGILLYDSNIRIKNEFTVWFMKQIGFEWNETDYEYIRGYIEYFRELDYLKV